MTSHQYSERENYRLSTIQEKDENSMDYADDNNMDSTIMRPERSISSMLRNSRLSMLEEEMQTFAEKKCECKKFESVLKEYQALKERFQTYIKSKHSSTLDSNCTSFLGASQISFLEHEAQVYAENDCQCNRFRDIIKEYNAILVDSETNDEKEMLKQELEKAKLGAEEQKKAAESAKMKAQNMKIALEEEKKRAIDQNNILQQQFEAMKLAKADVEKNFKEQLSKLNAERNVMEEEINELKQKLDDSKNNEAKIIAENEFLQSENAKLKQLHSTSDMQNSEEQNDDEIVDSPETGSGFDGEQITGPIAYFSLNDPASNKTEKPKTPYRIKDYTQIPKNNWKSINKEKISEGIAVTFDYDKKRNERVTASIKFNYGGIYRHGSMEEYILFCEDCQASKESKSNKREDRKVGKIFFYEEDGEYHAKQGAHYKSCIIYKKFK